MKNRKQTITRRRFLKETAGGAGILAVGSGSFAASVGFVRAGSAGNDPNPFAYDVERLRKTDPKLIHYEQVGQFRGPSPDPRRIVIGPSDRVYIAAGNSVSVLDREGARLSDIGLGTAARCVAVAGDGTIYAGARDHVEVFDPKGKRLATWESPGPRTWFTGLAVGEKDVFAADAGNRVVLRYDKSGKLAGRIGEKNKERNIPGIIMPSPYLDVKLARDGLLRVNNTGPASRGGLHAERRPGVLVGQTFGCHRGLLRLLQPGRPGAAAGWALCDVRKGSAAGEGLFAGGRLRVGGGRAGILC